MEESRSIESSSKTQLRKGNDLIQSKDLEQSASANGKRRMELVWEGKRTEIDRIALPFQRIELINESRATREAEKGSLFKGIGGESAQQTERNALIWGDNRYVLGSLADTHGGTVDLIYIDPPFGTGQDFSYRVQIGDEDVVKYPSLIEEKAYRDTWGRGIDSYLQVIYETLCLARTLLKPSGSVYVHIGTDVEHLVRAVCDEMFGAEAYRNTIIWQGSLPHGNITWKFGNSHDAILYYARGDEPTWNPQYLPHREEYLEQFYRYSDPKTGRRYRLISCINPNKDRPNLKYEWKGVVRVWKYSRDRMKRMDDEGLLVYSKNGIPQYKGYLDDMKGTPMQDVWDDISTLMGSSNEWAGYPTQKPLRLAERIISASSNEGDLVMDFFCGSGTTLVAAEKLKRRWVGCDLGRFAIHTTRKRLLGLEGCRPFEILNLGRYERQYWQGISFGDGEGVRERALHEYLKFILDLYRAEPVSGLVCIHGQRSGRMVHIGAADAPVTLSEIREALDECKKLRQSKLDILGWEWEMGLHDIIEAESARSGVQLRLLNIPREVMDRSAVEAGDIRFYELAHLEVDTEVKGRSLRLRLKNFVIPSPELIPDEVRKKIRKWSDYIDYWSIDFEFNEDIFHNQWQDYRTREDGELGLVSDWHDYTKAGRHRVLIKVFDIFGNDTTQLLEVRV